MRKGKHMNTAHKILDILILLTLLGLLIFTVIAGSDFISEGF